jgi:SAM-dependent methyltransferase
MMSLPQTTTEFVVRAPWEEVLETDLLSRQRIAVELVAEFDRLTLEMRDVPSTAAALKRLVRWLGEERSRALGSSWRLAVEVLRSHELGRLLRTDPMVRRCQWRPRESDAYSLVEPFVWAWDDARDAIIEADEPGRTVNTVFMAMGLGAAMRERRDMVHTYLSMAAGPVTAVLGLGAGRAPEANLAAPDGPLDIGQWTAVDPASGEDAVLRRKKASRVDWRIMPLVEFLDTRRDTDSFDLIYLIDALDALDDRAATSLVEKAVRLLRPNGRLLLSAFVPDLPEAAYLDAVLDWRPVLRGESEIAALLKGVAVEGRIGISAWRGGSERVAFGVLERLSWAT